MRVLFLTGEFPPMQGGVGDCTNEIAKALAALGVQVCVLTAIQAADGTRNTQYALRPFVKKWDLYSIRLIRQTIRDFSPDIVHIQYQTAAFGMHPAINLIPRSLSFFRERRWGVIGAPVRAQNRRPIGVRVVVTFHDLKVPYLFPKAGRVRDWVTRELARSSDAVIATNDEDYLVIENWGLRFLSLIPIGSNIPTTQQSYDSVQDRPNYQATEWRKQLGVQDHETLLCYFGFLNESKGGETLIRALAEIPNAKLLMIGGQVGASDPTNAAYLSKVKSLIHALSEAEGSDLRLNDRVIWTDYTPPEIVTANFLASDICVLPYRDGASFRRGTLMAALAHGMAIVTTVRVGAKHSQDRSTTANMRANASPLPQLHDGENCLLVPPDNPRALADAIRRAADSPDLRAKIRTGARELAHYFTWDKIAEQHVELYERLVK